MAIYGNMCYDTGIGGIAYESCHIEIKKCGIFLYFKKLDQ